MIECYESSCGYHCKDEPFCTLGKCAIYCYYCGEPLEHHDYCNFCGADQDED